MWEACCDPEQQDAGIPDRGVVSPDYGVEPVSCEEVCCECDYGVIPEEVWQSCCEDPCEGVCCDCDYGDMPPDGCCP